MTLSEKEICDYKEKNEKKVNFNEFIRTDEIIHFHGHGSITSGVFIVPHNVEIWIPAAIGHPLKIEHLKYNKKTPVYDYHTCVLEPIIETMMIQKTIKKGINIKPYKKGNICLDMELSVEGGFFESPLFLTVFEKDDNYKKIILKETNIKLSKLIEKLQNNSPLKLYVWSCASMQTIPSWIKDSCYGILPYNLHKGTPRKWIDITINATNFLLTPKNKKECITDKNVLRNIYAIDTKFREFDFSLIREILKEQFKCPVLSIEEDENMKKIQMCKEKEEHIVFQLTSLVQQYRRNPKKEKPLWNDLEKVYEELKLILTKNNFKYRLWYHDFYKYVTECYDYSKPFVLHTEEPIVHGVENYKKVYPLLVGTYLPCLLVLLYEYCFDFDKMFEVMGNKDDVVVGMVKVLYEHMQLEN